jgi:hypothetical protein
MTHLLSANQASLLVILFVPYLHTPLSHSPRVVRKWGTKPNFCALLVSFVFCIESSICHSRRAVLWQARLCENIDAATAAETEAAAGKTTIN